MEMDHELAHTSGAMKSPEQSQRSFDRDEADLVRLGKKPVLKVSADNSFQSLLSRLTLFLKRRFGFMSLLGFSCTILITWEGILM